MIIVLDRTYDPIQNMGLMAGICWNANVDSLQKNYERGIDCLKSGHHRVAEYSDITIEISEYSARMIRELYTHIIGVTRLQESTRYVDCSNFNYYIPDSIRNHKDNEPLYFYTDLMNSISYVYKVLQAHNIPVQDIANILPLGMFTKIVLKINCRALMHMAEIRMCTRAYIEFREFMHELVQELSNISDEWKYFCDNYMKPKCEVHGYCNEKNSCGRLSSIGKE